MGVLPDSLFMDGHTCRYRQTLPPNETKQGMANLSIVRYALPCLVFFSHSGGKALRPPDGSVHQKL
ncbi:hypothetical protein HMPREF1981_01773 [Bacteroides pyogenes F0041]|uniref:Uncharacterized protein n=1 Tax=Bacteroides pyogenes F0041 TaxID=1321819 RepID=U2C4L4_9BACE|nr:hypothetical protein [Bacteroides pyogenes]ERI85419.1 hypothetical protein HMPREF1981_01773 [Bacteroides pyogenes F0041]